MADLSINVRSNASLVAMELLAAGREMQAVATARALNKLMDRAKVQAARQIRDAGYNLKISDIKSGIRIQRATAGTPRAALIAKGRPVPLIKYSARETSKGVSVNVLKGRKLIAGAFIATMPGGHRGVFVRDGHGKHKKVKKGGRVSWHELPIRELFGPSIPDSLANAQVQEQLQRMVMDTFPDLLEHESEWLRKRAARR